MALVSVIIPCYNVENYIDRCMNSVVNQTIGVKNLEIIMVNDASTDRTLEKLQQWEGKYPENVMVISYEENLRQGGARNIGMQYATSKYIGFVDADDYIENDMYELLYKKAEEGDFSMVYGGLKKVILNSSETEFADSNTIVEWGEQNNKFNGVFYEQENPISTGSVCAGIYLREMIIDNNLWFPEKISYEDNFWSECLKLFVPNMCYADKIVYYYCVNSGSTVQKRNDEHHLDRLEIEIMIVEAYKSVGAFEYYREYLKSNFIRRFYLNTLHLIFTRFDYIPDVFGFMKEKVKEYFPDYAKNNGNDDNMSKALVGLLDIDRDLELWELENVKNNYLNLMK